MKHKTFPLDEFAEKYNNIGGDKGAGIIFPEIIRYIGNVNGKKILDFGCGSGGYSKKLNDDGAEVVGVDISEIMIENARASYPDIEFIMIDDCEMPFPDKTFDVVVSNLVFLMIDSKEKMMQIAKGLYNVLKQGGLFAFSTTHPCFIDRDHFFFRNTFEDGFDYFNSGSPVGLYLRGTDGSETYFGNTSDFQYTVSDYIGVILNAGFTLEHFKELRYPNSLIENHPGIKDLQSISPYILIGARK